jgi:hypothetical protein
MVCDAMVEAMSATVESGGLIVDCGSGSTVDEDDAGSTNSDIGAAAGVVVGAAASVGAGSELIVDVDGGTGVSTTSEVVGISNRVSEVVHLRPLQLRSVGLGIVTSPKVE